MAHIVPKRIRIEASSVCQLRCRACPMASGAGQAAVGSGFLALEDFERILQENPRLERVELSNYGEILLNPALTDILRLAFERGVALHADNGVNFNDAKPELVEALVKYRLVSMSCSIDGASQASYSLYRNGGDFDRVIANIKTLNAFKGKYGSERPSLCWQFVVFGHNEGEIGQARRMAADLGMDFRLKLSWDSELSPVKDKEGLRRELGAATREEYRARTGRDYAQGCCHQLWDSPQINWDGKVLGCARNFWGDFGPQNAFVEGLSMALDGERMAYAKMMLQGKRPSRADIPCAACEIYQGMRADGAWLRRPSWMRVAAGRAARLMGIAPALKTLAALVRR